MYILEQINSSLILLFMLLPGLLQGAELQQPYDLIEEFLADIHLRHSGGRGDLQMADMVLLCSPESFEQCRVMAEKIMTMSFTLMIGVWSEPWHCDRVHLSKMTLFFAVSLELLLQRPDMIQYSGKNTWYLPSEIEGLLPVHALKLTSIVQLYGPVPGAPEVLEIAEVYCVKDLLFQKSRGHWRSGVWFQLRELYIWEQRKDLGGVHFKTAVERNPPASELGAVDQRGVMTEISGMGPDIFNEFQAQFNFSYDMVVAPGRAWGSKSLETNEWNGESRYLHVNHLSIQFVF